MWTRLRVCIAAVGFSVLSIALGGCNDDSDGPVPSSSAATVDSAPVISGSPSRMAVAGQPYEFNPTVKAAQGTSLKFAISNQPVWAAFDASTGRLAGTPRRTDTRVYPNISIRVSSGRGNAVLSPFSIEVVAAAEDALAISGTPASSASPGAPYSFQPTVSNAGSSALSFSISNLPSWAKFDNASGLLSGTPPANDIGIYALIVITVSAGEVSASLAPFSINVTSGSSAVATVTWAAPAGAAAAEVTGYRVYYGTSAAAMTRYVSIADPTASSYVISNLSAGTWYFAIASYDADQTQSPLSPIVAVSL